jgi:hypothetical protein
LLCSGQSSGADSRWARRDCSDAYVLNALEKAIIQRRPKAGLIIHTDGGGQYGSKAFRKKPTDLGFLQSMTRKDNHYDNAQAESLFSRFKAELLEDGVFLDVEDARQESFDYIEGYYNTVRRHSSLVNQPASSITPKSRYCGSWLRYENPHAAKAVLRFSRLTRNHNSFDLMQRNLRFGPLGYKSPLNFERAWRAQSAVKKNDD